MAKETPVAKATTNETASTDAIVNPGAETATATPATATPAKAEKPAKPTIEFLKAEYGIEGNRVEFTPIAGRKLTNKLVGTDPVPKVVKNAIIKAKINGKEVEKTFQEGEFIDFSEHMATATPVTETPAAPVEEAKG